MGTKLQANKSAIIRKLTSLATFEDVADILELSPDFLKTILYGIKERRRYKLVEIPKKTGGTRSIHVPPKNIKILQKKVNAILSTIYRPKHCVHAFTKKKSILTNARPHQSQRWILNLDLLDFFGHIHINRIIGALSAAPFNIPKKPATVISQIACLPDGKLPQGSPCSPIISNIVAYGLDKVLIDFAKKYHCTYSRYADDITFSTSKKRFPKELAEIVDGTVRLGPSLIDTIEEQSFKINPHKNRLQGITHHQEVTGLTVNEFPNVRREYIRDIRAMIHGWRTTSYEKAQQKLNEILSADQGRTISLRHHIRGKIAYLEAIRGSHDPVVRKLLKQLYSIEPDLVSEPHTIAQLPSSPLRGHKTPSLAWEKICKRLSESVFFLEVNTETMGTCVATAFKITDQLLATAGHNLEHEDVRIRLDTSTIPLQKIKKDVDDSGRDVGILSTYDNEILPGTTIKTQLRLPEIGEQVAAIGYPSQPLRQPTISLYVGIVESLPLSYSEETKFIQVSFQSAGGLSGSPLIDRGGYVIGIMTENAYSNPSGDLSTSTPQKIFGQAMPIEYYYDMLQELRNTSSSPRVS